MVSGTMNTAIWVSGWLARLAAVAGVTPAIKAAAAPPVTRAVVAMATRLKLFRLGDVDLCMGSTSDLVITVDSISHRNTVRVCVEFGQARTI